MFLTIINLIVSVFRYITEVHYPNIAIDFLSDLKYYVFCVLRDIRDYKRAGEVAFPLPLTLYFTKTPNRSGRIGHIDD